MIRADLIEAHDSQVAAWPLARLHYEALAAAERREISAAGAAWSVLRNPARAVSAAARVDAASVAARPCFLCAANRPAEQVVLASYRGYQALVNPFPVFHHHFTIAADSHRPQCFMPPADPTGPMEDIMAWARALPGMALFYNGPRCGASAPDHFHFQAVPAECLPLVTRWLPEGCLPIAVRAGKARTASRALGLLGLDPGDGESMMNLYAWADPGATGADAPVNVAVVPRRAHRPSCYGTGEGQMLVSPAAIECAGVVITPREEDFRSLDGAAIERIFAEVCLPPLR